MARTSQGSHLQSHEGQGGLLSQERACAFPSATLLFVAFSGHDEVTDLLSGPPAAFPNTCSLCWVRSRKDDISENTYQLLLRESFLWTIHFRVFKRVLHWGGIDVLWNFLKGQQLQGLLVCPPHFWSQHPWGWCAVWAPQPPSSLLRDVCLP